MKKVCKECGINVSDERLIVCPECSGELVTKITNEQAQTIVLSDQQKSELIKAATKGAAKQLLKWSWGVIAVLAILSSIYSGWTLDQI